MAFNRFEIWTYWSLLGACLAAVIISVGLANLASRRLTVEQQNELQRRAGGLFEGIAIFCTIGVPGGFWVLHAFWPDFYNEHLFVIIRWLFAGLTLAMGAALIFQYRTCRKIAPPSFFGILIPAKLLGWAGIICMITLVLIETRPLPGEEGAEDSFPNYRSAVTAVLEDAFPDSRIGVRVEFGGGELRVRTITVNGNALARDDNAFAEIERRIASVPVSSRLKRLEKTLGILAKP